VHGIRVVKLPWAEPSSRFTALFEALAIEWLKEASQKAVAGRLQLSWDEIHAIMERAVKRGLNRRKVEPVSQIGVDDKAFRKGHSYLTLVNDLHRGRVLCVAEERRQSSLDGFWETLTWNKSAALTRWRSICIYPTSLQYTITRQRLITRLFLSSFTSCSTWGMRLTGCGARRTEP